MLLLLSSEGKAKCQVYKSLKEITFEMSFLVFCVCDQKILSVTLLFLKKSEFWSKMCTANKENTAKSS